MYQLVGKGDDCPLWSNELKVTTLQYYVSPFVWLFVRFCGRKQNISMLMSWHHPSFGAEILKQRKQKILGNGTWTLRICVKWFPILDITARLIAFESGRKLLLESQYMYLQYIPCEECLFILRLFAFVFPSSYSTKILISSMECASSWPPFTVCCL